MTDRNNDKIQITRYPDTDTRYGFMIQDSDEYNTRIYPLGIREKCCPQAGNGILLNRTPPQAVGCVGERYENCTEYKKYNKEYVGCDLDVYVGADYLLDDDSSDESSDNQKVLKKLNNNSFIDKTRLSKISYPDLDIDRSPDVSQKILEQFSNHRNITPLTSPKTFFYLFIVAVILTILMYARDHIFDDK